MTLAVSDLESLYAECYSRKLQTAVYAARDINQVLRAKQLKKVIQVRLCVPRFSANFWLAQPCSARLSSSLRALNWDIPLAIMI